MCSKACAARRDARPDGRGWLRRRNSFRRLKELSRPARRRARFRGRASRLQREDLDRVVALRGANGGVFPATQTLSPARSWSTSSLGRSSVFLAIALLSLGPSLLLGGKCWPVHVVPSTRSSAALRMGRARRRKLRRHGTRVSL